MKSWDGGDNSIDSSLSDRHRLKRSRDGWDEEMDKGKVTSIVSSLVPRPYIYILMTGGGGGGE